MSDPADGKSPPKRETMKDLVAGLRTELAEILASNQRRNEELIEAMGTAVTTAIAAIPAPPPPKPTEEKSWMDSPNLGQAVLFFSMIILFLVGLAVIVPRLPATAADLAAAIKTALAEPADDKEKPEEESEKPDTTLADKGETGEPTVVFKREASPTAGIHRAVAAVEKGDGNVNVYLSVNVPAGCVPGTPGCVISMSSTPAPVERLVTTATQVGTAKVARVTRTLVDDGEVPIWQRSDGQFYLEVKVEKRGRKEITLDSRFVYENTLAHSGEVVNGHLRIPDKNLIEVWSTTGGTAIVYVKPR